MNIATLALALAATLAATPSHEVAPGVHLIQGAYVPGHQPDGNSTILEAPEGLVVVDTGRHAAHTRRILELAESRKRPIVAIVNTHWHLDHTGGNVLLRTEVPEAKIYASGAIDGALSGFLANYAQQLEELIAETKDGPVDDFKGDLALIQAGRKLAPDVVVGESGTREPGGLPLQFHLETDTVTAGDLWLFEPKTKTLIAGDLVTLPFPFLDTACPARWKDALARLSAVEFERLIPGHGAPMTHAEFERYRTAYDNLLACGASARTNEECATGWLHDAGVLVKHDAPFVRQALDYYIDGFLRKEADGATKYCGAR